MLHKRAFSPPQDPFVILAGLCGTCKTVAECQRKDAAHPPMHSSVGTAPGTWNDLLSTECPKCHARVYLMLKNDFLKCYPPAQPERPT